MNGGDCSFVSVVVVVFGVVARSSHYCFSMNFYLDVMTSDRIAAAYRLDKVIVVVICR